MAEDLKTSKPTYGLQEEWPSHQWVEKMYAENPEFPIGRERQFAKTYDHDENGEPQSFATASIKPWKPNEAYISWFQAYPLRSGVGTRAMQEILNSAKEHNIKVSLSPWEKGQVAKGNLIKFYRKNGFKQDKNTGNMVFDPALHKQNGGGIGWSTDRTKREISSSHYEDGRSKSHVGYVNPMDFLHATTPDDKWLQKIIDDSGNLDKEKIGEEIQSPFLTIENGKIHGHEGRHRMAALAKVGYTSVPIAIHHRGSGQHRQPIDEATFEPEFKGRKPITVSKMVPLQGGYKKQINDMMEQHADHFQDGGITAYHGSPHEFERFDTSKIGTGEGNQAFGHGLYFAESEPVAVSYRNKLSALKTTVMRHVLQHAPEMEKIRLDSLLDIRNASYNLNNDPLAAAHEAQNKNTELQKFDAQKIAKIIESHRNEATGHMYEVHIDAHPDHFLDWDKPLSEQSYILKAIDQHIGDPQSVIERLSPTGSSNITGRELYEAMGGQHKASAVSQRLHEMGIHGIRYLDAGSRGPTDQPTHNYVVFDHNDVNIKRRYEQGGTVKREAFGFGGETEFAGSGPIKGATGSAPAQSAANASNYIGGSDLGGYRGSGGGGGGGGGGASQVAFPGGGSGTGGDAVRQSMEFAFPTKVSGFGGAPGIGMPQSLKELQGFNPRQDQQDQTDQSNDFFAKAVKQATFLPSVGTTTFDQTVGGLPSGSFTPDISKYSMINPASAPKTDLMNVSGIDPSTGAKVVAGMVGTQPDRPYGSAAQLIQSAAAQRQPIESSTDTSDIFASYFQDPSKQTTKVAQATQASPSVDYNVKFDPVTQGFVRTSEPQQPGPITQIAMAAPPAHPITPTPSTAYQPAPLAQPAGTPTMGYEPKTQLAQPATGLTYQPQVSASFKPPARPITLAPQPQQQPQQLAQAATGLTYTPTAAAVPMPQPRPTQVAAAAPASEQDALVLPGRKTFQQPTNAPLPTPRPSDLPQPNIISDIIDPVMAQMAFAEGQRINDLEAMGKTATYPGYSTPSDPEAASRQYAQAIGLNPNDPADMAKVKARIIQQDGQDRVDYYTKSLPEAIFGTGQPQTQAQIGQQQATTSDRTGPRRRLVRKLMPDGTYQDVYEDYKRGGKVKSYPLARVAKNRLKQMSPDQFLSRARPLKDTKDDRTTINNFKKSMKKGDKLDPLALYPENKENGRHRATAAKELGIKKVPVHDYRKRDGGAIVKHALMLISKKA